MTGVTPTITPVPEPSGNPQGWKYQWVLANSQTGAPILNEFLAQGDRSVQVEGTFSGATVAIQGSNDDSNFHTLHDPLGNLLSYTSSGLNQILEVADQIQPSVSGGGGGTSITVTIVIRTTNK